MGTMGIGYRVHFLQVQGHRVHFLQVLESKNTFLTGTGVTEYISYMYRGHRVHFLQVQGSQITFSRGTGVIGYIFNRYRGQKVYFYLYRGQKVPFLQIYFFGAYIEYISFKYTCHRKHSKVNYFIYLFIFSSPTIQSGVPLAKNRYGTAIINQTTRYIR